MAMLLSSMFARVSLFSFEIFANFGMAANNQDSPRGVVSDRGKNGRDLKPIFIGGDHDF
jgi:hypothetical protein